MKEEDEDRLMFNTSVADLGQRAEDLAMDIIRLATQRVAAVCPSRWGSMNARTDEAIRLLELAKDTAELEERLRDLLELPPR